MVYHYEDGSYEEGSLVEGFKDGKWVSYYDNGNKQLLVNYKKGVKQGRVLTYYQNGKLSSEGYFCKDILCGKIVSYYHNGNKNYEKSYSSAGKGEGLFQLWYEDGTIKKTGVPGRWKERWRVDRIL